MQTVVSSCPRLFVCLFTGASICLYTSPRRKKRPLLSSSTAKVNRYQHGPARGPNSPSSISSTVQSPICPILAWPAHPDGASGFPCFNTGTADFWRLAPPTAAPRAGSYPSSRCTPESSTCASGWRPAVSPVWSRLPYYTFHVFTSSHLVSSLARHEKGSPGQTIEVPTMAELNAQIKPPSSGYVPPYKRKGYVMPLLRGKTEQPETEKPKTEQPEMEQPKTAQPTADDDEKKADVAHASPAKPSAEKATPNGKNLPNSSPRTSAGTGDGTSEHNWTGWHSSSGPPKPAGSVKTAATSKPTLSQKSTPFKTTHKDNATPAGSAKNRASPKHVSSQRSTSSNAPAVPPMPQKSRSPIGKPSQPASMFPSHNKNKASRVHSTTRSRASISTNKAQAKKEKEAPEIVAWGSATIKVDPRLENAKEIVGEWNNESNVPAWGIDPDFPQALDVDYDTMMKNHEAAIEHVSKHGPKPARSSHWKANKTGKRPLRGEKGQHLFGNPDLVSYGKWDEDKPESDHDDPYYDVKKLAGWDGRFQAPPEDWAARDRNVFSQDKVVNQVWIWMLTLDDEACTPDFTSFTIDMQFKNNQELVSKTWILDKIEGQDPRLFWNSFVSRCPSPVDTEDLKDSENRPYWELYDKTSPFMPEIVAPKAVLDQSDFNNRHSRALTTANELVLRCKKHHLAKIELAHASEPIFTPLEQDAMTRQAQKMIQIRQKTALKEPEEVLADSKAIKLESNVYLRPVRPSDVVSVLELYNHFVAETISVPEFQPVKFEHMVDRVNTVTSQNLPYIVAVAKNYKPPKGVCVSEKVVGFVALDDFCGKRSMYRYTFELELFVHPEWQRQHIGSCLMDCLLNLACNSYMPRGGYEYLKRDEYLKNGIGRAVKVIKAEVAADCRKKPQWVMDFFGNFGFRKAGHLREVGYKYGQIVDIVNFQYTTDETINKDLSPEL
ncbi:unnamed protein product [Periconia digitata]|uniref:N-acetyltransferase domain-containing protein n=1 Tax=Periconia digitata TaxID=1303443 RepID=A0A9W4XLW8_9PLEO|nr:unnamed protein product [Periconia digitata]